MLSAISVFRKERGVGYLFTALCKNVPSKLLIFMLNVSGNTACGLEVFSFRQAHIACLTRCLKDKGVVKSKGEKI